MSKNKKDKKGSKKAEKEPEPVEEVVDPLPDLPEWSFYYWDLRNRGNFIRLQFAYTNTEFSDISSNFRNNFAAFTALDKLNPSMTSLEGYHSPPFTVPCIRYYDKNPNGSETTQESETNGKGGKGSKSGKKNDTVDVDVSSANNKKYEILFISQAGPCAEFVASQLDLLPKTDNIKDLYRAKKLFCDCNDLLDELRNQLTKDNATAKHYLQNRFLKRLNVLEYPLGIQHIKNNNDEKENKIDENKDDGNGNGSGNDNNNDGDAVKESETNKVDENNNAENGGNDGDGGGDENGNGNAEDLVGINNDNDDGKEEIVYYYFGDNVTYIDLAVFNIVDGIYELLPRGIFNTIFSNYKWMIKLYNNIIGKEEIKNFVKKQADSGFTWWPKSVRDKVNQNLTS